MLVDIRVSRGNNTVLYGREECIMGTGYSYVSLRQIGRVLVN